jgi:hypothetical protein
MFGIGMGIFEGGIMKYLILGFLLYLVLNSLSGVIGRKMDNDNKVSPPVESDASFGIDVDSPSEGFKSDNVKDSKKQSQLNVNNVMDRLNQVADKLVTTANKLEKFQNNVTGEDSEQGINESDGEESDREESDGEESDGENINTTSSEKESNMDKFTVMDQHNSFYKVPRSTSKSYYNKKSMRHQIAPSGDFKPRVAATSNRRSMNIKNSKRGRNGSNSTDKAVEKFTNPVGGFHSKFSNDYMLLNNN